MAAAGERCSAPRHASGPGRFRPHVKIAADFFPRHHHHSGLRDRLKQPVDRVRQRPLQAAWRRRLERVLRRVRGLAQPQHQPLVIDDLTEWCAARGIETRTLSRAQGLVRRLPTALGATSHESFERRMNRSVEDRVLRCLPDARLAGPNGLLILSDGAFVAEAVYGRSHLEVEPAYVAAPARVVRKSGQYFSLLGKFSNAGNYYHWIHDGLLRLHGVDGMVPPDAKYLVPPLQSRFQMDSLRMLGLSEDQLVTFTGEEVWECEKLWFASLPPSGSEVPEAIGWLRERLSAAAGTPDAEPARRIYISRRRAAHARVVNEDELVPVLERHGYEIVELSGTSLVDQIRLFAQAASIVAPHGAGMTNMLFAGPRCSNLELLEPRWATNGHAYVFWTLAQTLGQSFAYVVAESVTNPENDERANLFVSPAVLDRALISLHASS